MKVFWAEDYKKMKAMIFRNYPSWYKIMEYLKELEQNIHDIKFE